MVRELQNILTSGEVTDQRMEDAYVPSTPGRVTTKRYVDEPFYLDFKPDEPINPVWKEGRVFFDSEFSSLSYYTDIPGVTINLAQEQVTRVRNNTGVAILNGSVCRIVSAIDGIPEIVLAQADTLANAITAGVATHDIPDGSLGFITYEGRVGMDTTGFPPIGSTLYLSETVPGGVTSEVSDILSKVGIVVDSGVNGAISVRLINLYSLPNIIGILSGIDTNYNFGSTETKIAGFNNSDSVVMSLDPVAGEVSIPVAGWYRGNFTGSFTLDSTNSTRILQVRIFDVLETISFSFYISLARDADSISFSFNVALKFDTPMDIAIGFSSVSAVNNVDFQNLIFDVQSIHIV